MELAEPLANARNLSIWIHDKINDISIPSDDRTKLSTAIFQQTLDVADGIIILLERNYPGPAWALSRPLYEGYVRAVWLLNHADENQIINFLNGICPKIQSLVNIIDEDPESGGEWIKKIYELNINDFHDLAHGGMTHVLRRVNEKSIEPNYSNEENIIYIKLRNQCFVNVAVFMLSIIKDEEKLKLLKGKIIEWKTKNAL